jgi:plasmid stabilization system protein ParE
MRIVWTEPASHDLEEIGDYIAKDNPAAARHLVRASRPRCDGSPASRIAGVPDIGQAPGNSWFRELPISCRIVSVPERSKS